MKYSSILAPVVLLLVGCGSSSPCEQPVHTGTASPADEKSDNFVLSPGEEDGVTISPYSDISKAALKNATDFHELTSYAGRRNSDRK